MTRRLPPPGKVLRHPALLRLSHWAHAAVVLALAFTGFYLAHPFLPASLFQVRYARLAHSTLAALFTGVFWVWLYYTLVSGAWRDLIPNRRDWRTAGDLLRYELLLTGEKPTHGKYHLLQKLLYLSFHLAALLQLATGWALAAYSTRSGSLIIRLAGDFQRVRLVHHFSALYLVLTATLHLYRVLGEPDALSGMLTGWAQAVPPLDTPGEKDTRPPGLR